MYNWKKHVWLKIAGCISIFAIVIAFLMVFQAALIWLFWLMAAALAILALCTLAFGFDKLHEIITRIWHRQIDTQIRQTGRDGARQKLAAQSQRDRIQYERAIKERARQKQALLPMRVQAQARYQPQYRELPAPRQERGYAEVRETTRNLPDYVAYDEITVKRGQFVLGVNENMQVAHCPFEHLQTMWIVGGSDTGKSKTVALKVYEAKKNGRDIKIILIDPHKRKPDSLYNRLRCYEHLFLCVAQTDEEIYDALCDFKAEYDMRQGMETEELEEFDDILLICDEVKRVSTSEDERIGKLVKRIAQICGYESRGFGMFGWFISQQASGLKWLRDAVMTTIVHKMHTMEERELALNGNKKIAREMDSWSVKGRVAIYGQAFDNTYVLQMPDFEIPASEYRQASRQIAHAASRVPQAASRPVPTFKREPEMDIIAIGKQVYQNGATSLDKFSAAMTEAGVPMSREQARKWKPRVEIALQKEQAQEVL